MKIARCLPPAAAMMSCADISGGVAGLMRPGRFLAAVRSELKEYFGVRHVFLLSSGKAALTVILQALHELRPARQEVVIPAYTCYSVPSAVTRAGLKIVPCDLDPVTFDFDQQALRQTITDATLCVVPTHFFGIPADLEPTADLCRKHGALVVEDAAQAMGGATPRGKLGTLGDIGFFSLGRGKNITAGSGGIIVTNDDTVAAVMARITADLPSPSFAEDMKNLLSLLVMMLLIHPTLYWLPAGLSFLKLGQTFFERDFPLQQLSGAQAGVLRHWRRRLQDANDIRTRHAAAWKQELGAGLANGSGIPLLRYPILCATGQERNRFAEQLTAIGAGVSTMYPLPVHQIPEIRALFSGQSFPGAETLASRMLTLPTHHFVRPADRQRAAAAFKEGNTINTNVPAAGGI